MYLGVRSLTLLAVLGSASLINAATIGRRAHGKPSSSHHNPKLVEKRADPLLVGWDYVACVWDGSEDRLLPHQIFSDDQFTVDACLFGCVAAGYKYGGLSHAQECYCGNSLSHSPLLLQDSSCDSTQTCGGSDALAIYGEIVTAYETLGCYTDSASPRTLDVQSLSYALTPQRCQVICAAQNMIYAGTEAGNECWCSNTAPNVRGTKVADSECNTACNGDSSKTCGGPWRLTVYGRQTSVPLGCFTDEMDRTLEVQIPLSNSMTNEFCQSQCAAQGLAYSGTQYGVECWCSNTAPTVRGEKVADSECNMACGGNSADDCGGVWRLSVFGPAGSAGPMSTTTTTATSTTMTATTATTTAAPTPTKLVVAHFMVGNTYSYNAAKWLTQIQMATAQGIDAFALNTGSADSWFSTQIQSAYDTAASSGTGFKMFISFDASTISNDNAGADWIRNKISTYANHAAQLKDSTGKSYVSTFGGQDRTFGRASVNAGWQYAVKDNLPGTVFLPSYFTDPGNFAVDYPVQDGYFNWNGGWPLDNHPINWGSDAYTITGTRNGKPNAIYMAAVSPWFFTHYGPTTWNKNWIYRSDDWLFANRWEDLFAHRNEIDIVQLISWNDYGESHYVGPIEVDQPNSQAWVNGFDHHGWLKLAKFYGTAFKTGAYPAITQDQVFLWARPHGKNDVASNDPSGPRPDNADWTEDYLWAVLLSTGTGTLTLTSGSNTQSFSVNTGINKFKLAQAVGGVNAKLVRNGGTVFDFTPSPFSFTHSPVTYNFNAYVASYP